MNKTYKLSALWMLCLMLFSCLSFTACDNGDDEDTNQYIGGISLNVFGPSPVARGGELRFLGSGMDKISAVVIPGCDEITDIQVVSNTEIRVTVPQTAQPGLVILKTPTEEITTKTKLTFTEPISLEALTPNSIKPGQELIITGEYLNLIKEVIFADNVIVKSDAFTKSERKEIRLIVPVEAQTGKIIISDGAEIPNWIYSENELAVVLPSVAELQDLTAKKPGDVIMIEGEDLDLVEKVLMPNEDEVEFTVEAITDAVTKSNGEMYKLSFTLPANISDGAIVMVPASGVPVAIANIGVALPANVAATPANDIRANDVITLTGVNMELVTTLTFPGVKTEVEPTSKTATEIKVTVPGTAISGDLLLNTNSGKSVKVAIATAKPKNISYSVNTVPAGESLTISGSNLDVVSSVLFSGDVEVEVSADNPTTLTVVVPTTASTGIVVLKMANGESAECPSLTVEKPVCAYLPSIPEQFMRGRIVELEMLNGDKLSSVQLNGASVQYINDVAKGLLMLNIPSKLEGTYPLKLVSTNGEISYDVVIVAAETTIWTGPVDITWADGGRVVIPAASFSKVTAGTKLRIYFDQKDGTWAQAQINDGSFGGLIFPEIGNNTLVPTDDKFFGWTFGSRKLDVTLTQDVLKQIDEKQALEGDFSGAGIIIQGSDLIFQKITIVN